MVGYLLIAAEVAMAITGLIAIIAQRFPYRPGRPVTGLGAIVGGIIMILPLGVGLPLGWSIAARETSLAEAIGKVLVLHICFILFCFIGAYVTAALLSSYTGSATGRARGRMGRHRRDEDDDRPRRRRRRRDDYDDRRPPPLPRRRHDEEDEVEERPTRQREEDGFRSRDRDDGPRRTPDDDGSFRSQPR